MPHFSRLLPAILLAAAPLAAQTSSRKPAPSAPAKVAAADTSITDGGNDDEGVPLGLQYGVTTGALGYSDGRSEQALGAIVRWAPVRWFALSANPSGVHSAFTSTTRSTSRSGLVDLPVQALLSHAFAGVQYAPVLSGGLGVTLPTGDSASGFGSGQFGSDLNLELGFAPAEGSWVSLGGGHSLSGLQSGFSSGSSWGDISGGVSLTDRLSVNAGYGTDLGAVDATVGRSSSVNAGVAWSLMGPTTLNLSAGHGLGGIAPTWSFALGVGTAFPPLAHGGPSPMRKSFGGSGNGNGLGHHP
jgi:hypothetical protein